MAVTWEKFGTTNALTDFPDVDAANSYVSGWNVPGGQCEFLIIRGDITFDVDPAPNSDMSNLVKGLRVVVNGDVVFDFRNPAAIAADSNAPGRMAYLLNSIGGRAYDVPGTTTREWYWAVPLGLSLPQSVNRWEITLDWGNADADSDPTSGTIEYWLQRNSAMQTQTFVAPATSFQHTANNIEQVTIRVPTNVPKGMVVSALMIQNDSGANELGAQGLRINALGSFGIPYEMWTFLNGDIANGIQYSTGAAPQTFAIDAGGLIVIPVYGLTGGDITAIVDSTATTTRTYTPILTAPVGGAQSAENVQTQAAVGNTAASIIASALD